MSPPSDDFERFRALVREDEALQRVLWATPERAAFVAVAVRLGGERGLRFAAEDVEAALDSGRRAWLERWNP